MVAIAVLLVFGLVSCDVLGDVLRSSYTVTFDANGADSGTVPAVIRVQKESSFTVPSQGSLLKTDCVFAGWNTKPDGSGFSYYQGDQSLTVYRDTVLYAIWRDDFLGFTYLSNLDSYSVTGNFGRTIPFLIIPSEYKGKPVTSIGESAFAYCSSLEKITLPSSVTSIGNFAFLNCFGLTEITIPSSVSSIGSSVFYDCKGQININYSGSISQWNSIEKSSYWDDKTGNYTIHCTDGDIAKK